MRVEARSLFISMSTIGRKPSAEAIRSDDSASACRNVRSKCPDDEVYVHHPIYLP